MIRRCHFHMRSGTPQGYRRRRAMAKRSPASYALLDSVGRSAADQAEIVRHIADTKRIGIAPDVDQRDGRGAARGPVDQPLAGTRPTLRRRLPDRANADLQSRRLNAPPTGDGNTTEVFTCRSARGQTAWSQHAYGLAVDLNPFQNPYHKGEMVLPELATAYLDRAHARPGMVQPGGQAVQAFAAIGWPWGGDYVSLKDYMHFSATGRR
jgi:hypothetical protein